MYTDALKIVSSQLKLLPDCAADEICRYEISRASAMKNEPFSFQILYKAAPGVNCLPVSLAVISGEIPAAAWRVDYVPVINAANDYGESGYVGSAAGIYPDVLTPRPAAPEIIRKGGETNSGIFCEAGTQTLLNATCRQWQSVWITLNPDGVISEAGSYPVKISLISLSDGSLLCEREFDFEVIGAVLPPNTLCYTNWFHVDSLCDYHGVEPYTDEFYAIFDSYIKNAVRHRMNTLLLPAFTPALDTPRNCERRNVQLVGVSKDGSGWKFDFSRLAKFMREADKCGIRVFEHCHLFSQWGAENAPNIYDTDGKLLFGWETDASGAEYVGFIRAYLAEFLRFAAGEGYTKERLLFHISDEPNGNNLNGYRKAHDAVADLLSDYDMIDALSEVGFWRTGLVKTPVAFIAKADSFDGVCPRFWLYYTCGTYARGCSNRLVTNTAARTRVLGLQMYRYNAAGFLQWGYNFYYDRMSEGIYDPKSNPCGYKLLPGCSYLAYPVKGGAVPSVREENMREAFDDRSALELLESYIGRAKTIEFCEEKLGAKVDNHLIPEGNEMYYLREKINGTIKSFI